MSAQVRTQAISPEHSFLVQAPAGSGKTELLTQRILALLATVQEPEEILALTFTKKAAAEMRERVLHALNMPKPDAKASHRMHTWQLAQQALQHAHEKQWKLIENPNRLRVMTIDSLTHSLAKQLPLLSGLGDMPSPSEYPQTLYEQAAENTLHQAMKKHRDAVEVLLLHQDHKTGNVIALIANMLANREQWLSYIAAYGRNIQALRKLLESNLKQYMTHQLELCDMAMPRAYKASLPALLRFAAEHGGDESFAQLEAWPAAIAEHIGLWQSISKLLLTGKGEWRKTIDKRSGFPSDAKHEKNTFKDMLEQLGSDSTLIQAWQAIQSMPEKACFDETQWQTLEALFTLLPLAVAQLQQSFAQQSSADYTEISLRALHALSDEQGNPSDVLLKLDYRIQHILIDEFQDTSELQIQLLRCLTAGWQDDDGRTLFMVGDPMQSIYRFRKAEVSLFLQAADNQLSLPMVEPLSLQRNFRSSPTITHWINCAFAQILPKQSDPLSSAIAYTQADSACSHSGSVHLYQQEGEDNVLEAQAILAIVQQALLKKQRIGILARTRKHLHAIMPILEEANIAFRAINILPLHTQPEVRTLRALTRALLHPADRLSWTALLRAPCCGLNNQQLFKLLSPQQDDLTVWDILHDEKRLQSLDADSLARINHIKQALAPCVHAIARMPIRPCIESAWHRLGMPQLLQGSAHTNVETVLSLLENLEAEYVRGFIHFKHFDSQLEKLYAAPDNSPEAEQVELLTIHGAKGLQWDVVILPGMGKTGGKGDAPLLAFTEAPMHHQGLFLLSPKPQLRSQDHLYQFIRSIEKAKEEHELRRQLYVACTRAESELHMLGHLSEKSGNATKHSFLQILLEHDAACFDAEITQLEQSIETDTKEAPALHRMRDIPEPSPIACEPTAHDSIAFAWAGAEAAPIGNALHAMFQHIAEMGIEQWQHANNHKHIRHLLMAEGLSGELLEHAIQRCEKGLNRALHSPRAQWILSNQHAHSQCEWAISHQQADYIAHYVIDRSFEDEHGIRWIIDYKTASHEGGDLEAFLEAEKQRHQAQLERYALALHAMGHHNLRLALYFPMLDAWQEWDAPAVE